MHLVSAHHNRHAAIAFFDQHKTKFWDDKPEWRNNIGGNPITPSGWPSYYIEEMVGHSQCQQSALASLGEREAWRHIIVLREGSLEESGGWGALDTVLVARKPLTSADLARLREGIAGTRIHPVYFPDRDASNPFAELLHARDPRAFERAYPYDISTVDDNRPFFFYTVQPRDLWAFATEASTGVADLWVNLRSAAEERLVELQVALASIVEHGDELKGVDRAAILKRAQVGEVLVLDVRPEAEFAAAHRALSAAEMARVAWPSLPAGVIGAPSRFMNRAQSKYGPGSQCMPGW